MRLKHSDDSKDQSNTEPTELTSTVASTVGDTSTGDSVDEKAATTATANDDESTQPAN